MVRQLGHYDPTKRWQNKPALAEDFGAVPCSVFDVCSNSHRDGLKKWGFVFGHEFRHAPFQAGLLTGNRFPSVLDTRQGPWRKCVNWWKQLGMRSEEGRDSLKMFQSIVKSIKKYETKKRITKRKEMAAISIFDPFLCELLYRWYCPPEGVVLDPFAGGSVRGVVAAALGLRYCGCELRGEQVTANKQQLPDIASKLATMGLKMPHEPRWQQGDSLLANPPGGDFLFSCPPYGNLEVYSQDPGDISNLDDAAFDDAYVKIIKKWCGKLRDNRFAAFVVGNYRNRKTGMMRDLVGLTIDAFEAAGLGLYNEAVLVNVMGTGTVRASGTFERGSHKLVKCHQNVLVFAKGDPIKAAALCTNTEKDLRNEASKAARVPAGTGKRGEWPGGAGNR